MSRGARWPLLPGDWWLWLWSRVPRSLWCASPWARRAIARATRTPGSSGSGEGPSLDVGLEVDHGRLRLGGTDGFLRGVDGRGHLLGRVGRVDRDLRAHEQLLG